MQTDTEIIDYVKIKHTSSSEPGSEVNNQNTVFHFIWAQIIIFNTLLKAKRCDMQIILANDL